MPGTHLLPPNLLKLFAPRPPLPYTRPVDRDIDRVRNKNVTGVADILQRLKEETTDNLFNAVNNDDGMEEGEEPVYTLAEEVKRQLRREQRKARKADDFKSAKESYKPSDDPEAVGDPYKTLFISRLHKSATETDLRREFEGYGTIERVRIVRDKKGRSRGYAFIVYERERDMKAAYKESDGLHIMGKRILVDVERGRTVRGWKPRRLGGGLGGRPKRVEPVGPPPAARGGFRGGFGGGRGGGFRGGGGRGGNFGGRGGFNDRGGGFGDRGGFNDRGGGFGDRGGGGFGDRGDRGGFRGHGGGDRGGPGGFRGGRDDFGGGGGGFRYAQPLIFEIIKTDRKNNSGPPRGGGIGYHGNGGFDGPPNGFGGPPPGHAGPPGGMHGGYGGPRQDLKRENMGGYDDRDSKRPRY
ncbi:hypothetical protein MD484_g5918, partial [Candolleomyces efflorescens]